MSALCFSRQYKSFISFPNEGGIKINDFGLFQEKFAEQNTRPGSVADGSKVSTFGDRLPKPFSPLFFVLFNPHRLRWALSVRSRQRSAPRKAAGSVTSGTFVIHDREN